MVLSPHAGGALPVAGQLPREFTFPSGRRCRTLDDFVQGCQYEWEDARDLLRRGDFATFFTSIGRMDLAQAARETDRQTDADILLHNFLSNLPVQTVAGPRLDLHPRRLVLGKVKPGESKQLRLQVQNTGKGLLQGRVTVTEGANWLWVESDQRGLRESGSGSTGRTCALKTAREQVVTLRVDTRGLPAPQSYTAKLTVITNGGIAEVPVGLDLKAVAFAQPPFQGAATPREMAERMRANPKAAVPLLENGEIQRWFATNGWAYPVCGVPARGVAAVQQFFEAMGLSRPPPVQLSESEVHCLLVAPEVQQRNVILRTTVKKWVYAQVDSDVPWLRVLTSNVAGAQNAAIGFEIDSSLMDTDRVHNGVLKIVANGGQTLALRVRVDVRAPRRPFTRRLFGSFLTVALVALTYRLLFALPGDLFARVLAAPGEPPLAEVEEPPAPGTREYEERWLPPGSPESWARPAIREKGYLRRFVLATWWVGTLLGAWLVWRRRGPGALGSGPETVPQRGWGDVISGALAGTMAGVAVAVTAACLLTVGDAVPRQLLARFAEAATSSSAWLWTPVWIVVAVLWWAVVGAGAGLALRAAGQRGRKLLADLALPLNWLMQGLGMKRAADAFAVR
jgi:hypothetical protein